MGRGLALWIFICIGIGSPIVSTIWPSIATAQDQIPPPKSVAPHELIAVIDDQLDLLEAQQVLNRGQHESLGTKLNHAQTSLRNGAAVPALAHLKTFRAEVESLAKNGVIDEKNGTLLSDEAANVERILLDILTVPGIQRPLAIPCAPQGPCTRLVLHVRAPPVPTEPDGSSSAPFPRIADALAYAAAHGACGLDIVLGDGTYIENVAVTLPLSITGAGPRDTIIIGSILNRGAHDLSVSQLRLLASPDPGAIVVDGACPATTEITSVVISNATGDGIFQRDGSFRALSVAVRGTGIGADPNSGVGIRLVGGAQGVLGDVGLLINSAGGLAVRGPGTRVYVVSSGVDETDVNEALFSPDGTAGQGGAIEVTDGALLLAEFTNISHSQVVGLHVGSDAQAHYRYGRITNTVRTPAISGASGVAVHDATLEMSGFTVDHAEIVDVFVARSAVSLSDGIISYAPVGVGVVATPEDPLQTPLHCLRREVLYLHVDVDRFGGFDVPCPFDCPPPPPCVSVPFDVTWAIP